MGTKKTKRKKLNFISNSDNRDFYKNGAYAGALVGGLVGLITKKRIFLTVIIGALLGGYINSEIHKEHDKFSLKNKIK